MENIKTTWKPFLWHWKVVIKEVSNNYYVLSGTGPKGEMITLKGPNDVNKLITKIVLLILEQVPEKSLYLEYYEIVIIEKTQELKYLSYRLDISFEH